VKGLIVMLLGGLGKCRRDVAGDDVVHDRDSVLGLYSDTTERDIFCVS